MKKLYWQKVILCVLILLGVIYHMNAQLELISINDQEICVKTDSIEPGYQYMYYTVKLDSTGRAVYDNHFGTCNQPLGAEYCLPNNGALQVHVCKRETPPCSLWNSIPASGRYKWIKLGHIVLDNTTTVVGTDTVFSTDTITIRDTIFNTEREDSLYTELLIKCSENDSLIVVLEECRDSIMECPPPVVDDVLTCSNVYINQSLFCQVWAAPNPVPAGSEFDLIIQAYTDASDLRIEICDTNRIPIDAYSSPFISNVPFTINLPGTYYAKVMFKALGNIDIETTIKIIVI